MASISTIGMKKAALAALIAVGGRLAGAKVMLFTTPVIVKETMHVSDLVEATYTGYAQKTIAAWVGPYVDTSGLVRIDGGDLLFQPTDSVIQETIYGYAIINAAVVGPPVVAADVMYVETFAPPVPLLDADHGVVVDVTLPYGV